MSHKRKIIYISGTRADFGLMQSTLQTLDRDDAIELSIVVTGMHLTATYGRTITDIEATKIRICAQVETDLEPTTGATMARALGVMIVAFTDVFEAEKPDIILLLGDRGEMLAAAIAAIHLNIPVAHIHGGERSGTVDELVRHAISKLSHIHFVSTAASAQRLIKMGEKPQYVYEVGAPGLDGLTEQISRHKTELWAEQGLSLERPVALMLFHPVLQEAENAELDTTEILDSLLHSNWQIIALMPNADAGSAGIRKVLSANKNSDLHCVTHLPRNDFLGFMKSVDLMIGNSSAGIIEAASFGTPVVNIGSRQAFRERNANVIDIAPTAQLLAETIGNVMKNGRYSAKNIYGDGQAGTRICNLLKEIELTSELINKVMAY